LIEQSAVGRLPQTGIPEESTIRTEESTPERAVAKAASDPIRYWLKRPTCCTPDTPTSQGFGGSDPRAFQAVFDGVEVAATVFVGVNLVSVKPMTGYSVSGPRSSVQIG
jgi:hypothetical protein